MILVRRTLRPSAGAGTAAGAARCASSMLQNQKRSISIGTIDEQEVEKFKSSKALEALGEMHQARMEGIYNYLGKKHGLQHGMNDNNGQEIKFLDVGVGSGLLTRSLLSSYTDAKVTAIDAVAGNIEHTKQTVQDQGLNSSSFTGIHCTVEELLEQKGPESFDFVCALEVVEHVQNYEYFLECCSKLAKKGVILSTINRTIKSYLLAIVAAEYVSGKVPPGTHDWNKFIQPREIEQVIHQHKLHTDEVLGLVYNPVCSSWHPSTFETDVNYMLFASKD